MKAYALIALAVAALACGDDKSPLGPKPDDPVCERWELASVNGQPIPADVGGFTVTGGSIELLCTGWYRLVNEPAVNLVYVGRYTESGATIQFGAGRTHNPMIGTVEGDELCFEPTSGFGLAVYTRAP